MINEGRMCLLPANYYKKQKWVEGEGQIIEVVKLFGLILRVCEVEWKEMSIEMLF